MLYRFTKSAAEDFLKIKKPVCNGKVAKNRYCEWTVDSLILNRKKYFLVCNAYSMYGVVFPAKGINSVEKFNMAFLETIKSKLNEDNLSDYYKNYMAEDTEEIVLEGTHNLRLRSAMNNIRLTLSECSKRSELSDNGFNKLICDNYTGAFSSDHSYKHVTDDLFTNESMKEPAVPSPIKVKKDKNQESVKAFEIYAELEDFEPKTWRRFLICADSKMSTLAYALMAMFNAQGSHLFNFEVTETLFKNEFLAKFQGKINSDTDFSQIDLILKNSPSTMIEMPDPDGNVEVEYDYLNAKKVKIQDVMNQKTRCIFYYDFGDNWKFNVKITNILNSTDINSTSPVKILDGENLGILEDCGGVCGLEHIVKLSKNKNDSEYKEFCRWLDVSEIDFAGFDVHSVNKNIKREMKLLKNAYETWHL